MPDGSSTVAALYAGDLSPREAWDLLVADPTAQLIDVRSEAEWNFVGLPDLSSLNRATLKVQWQHWPTSAVNDGFVGEVRGVPQISADTPILLLCRSGVRSLAAAKKLTEKGYTRAYNIAGGFEGPLDPGKHRGSLAGWKVEGLPWSQA